MFKWKLEQKFTLLQKLNQNLHIRHVSFQWEENLMDLSSFYRDMFIGKYYVTNLMSFADVISIYGTLSKDMEVFWNVTLYSHYATIRKVVSSIPNEITEFFNWPNPSSRNMAPGSTQPLIEMSTRDFPRGIERPVREADNLTAICEPTV
jgi:hypothetical protein